VLRRKYSKTAENYGPANSLTYPLLSSLLTLSFCAHGKDERLGGGRYGSARDLVEVLQLLPERNARAAAIMVAVAAHADVSDYADAVGEEVCAKCIV